MTQLQLKFEILATLKKLHHINIQKFQTQKICIDQLITRFFLLCPSSVILKTREHNVSETGPVSIFR
jgi:hypothetical protein